MIKHFTALFLLCLLASCEKYYLSLRQVPVDAAYLASSYVGTPDPRQKDPPHGQKVVMQWAVPPDLLEKKPEIVLHVIYKNHTEKTFTYPVESRIGYEVYSLLNKEYDEAGGLLTYRADLKVNNEIYREWKHQLWVNLITLEEEKK